MILKKIAGDVDITGLALYCPARHDKARFDKEYNKPNQNI
jgi:hypothetical protein